MDARESLAKEIGELLIKLHERNAEITDLKAQLEELKKKQEAVP